MHLAFLTPEFPHAETSRSAGIGNSIKSLTTGLLRKGIKVSVFVYGQDHDAVHTEGDFKLHIISRPNFTFLGWYRYRKFLQNYLNRNIEMDKIDAMEAPDWTGITAFMKLKCPLVLRVHGSDTYFCHIENRPQKKKNFWFEKLAVSNADHLIAVSKFSADLTKRLFNYKKEITVIHNGVNTEFFEARQEIVPKDCILYFGSIIRKKGVLDLAEVFNLISAENEQIILSIAGNDVTDAITGRSTKDLFMEKLSAQALKKVQWLGNLDQNELKTEICKAKVLVFLSYAEAFPMAWLEAMSMKKAVVVSNIGWSSEIIENAVTGFTVKPSNHKEIKEIIDQFLKDDNKRNEIGVAARNHILKNFSVETIVERNLDFYKNITH